MAPFPVSFGELANRFGTTPPRWKLLQGLAYYRDALRATGITAGFQWIDGSFLEDSEALRGRPPADIDVVTFVLLPSDSNPRAFRDYYANLLDTRQTRPIYGCDAYVVDLGLGARRPDFLVMQARYWYGLFSHQRASSLWKGMLQIDLFSDDEKVMATATTPGGSDAPQA